MCDQFFDPRTFLPIGQRPVDADHQLVRHSFVLGKRTESPHFSNGHHYTRSASAARRGLWYPQGRLTFDPNAIVGDHDRAIHMAPTPNTAIRLLDESTFGECVMAMLPGRNYWRRGNRTSGRCEHSDSVLPLFCTTCEGYSPEELRSPAFWQWRLPPESRLALPDGIWLGNSVRHNDGSQCACPGYSVAGLR